VIDTLISGSYSNGYRVIPNQSKAVLISGLGIKSSLLPLSPTKFQSFDFYYNMIEFLTDDERISVHKWFYDPFTGDSVRYGAQAEKLLARY
jgi:hypothetical protein